MLALLLVACAEEKHEIAVSGGDLPIEGSAKLQVMAPGEGGELAPTDITYKMELTSPADLVLSAKGYEVVPAGTEQAGGGHFHLLWRELDPDEDASRAETACASVGSPIPVGDDIVHLDDGETETSLELDPGLYRVCVQLGDAANIALNPRDEYTIVIVDPAEIGSTTTSVVDGATTTTASDSTSTTEAQQGSTTTVAPGDETTTTAGAVEGTTTSVPSP